MPEILTHIFLYLLSFTAIWFGAGLIVSSVNKLSHSFRIPSFLISFVILGILTSTPEIAVGISAVSSNNPGIFVGNLLGGIPVLLLFVIPTLAILGKGIRLNHTLSQKSILLSLIASIAPFLVVLDGQVTNPEGAALILLYLIIIFLLSKNNNILNKKNAKLLATKRYSFMDIIKVLFGTCIVFISSNSIVSNTLYFSQEFQIAPFYISLIILSLGTNLPELTLALRSLMVGKNDIAFGDYLGSATANAFLFGMFTLMIPDPVIQVDNFLVMFILVSLGLILFFFFARSKHMLTRKEGFILLSIYLIFVVVEIVPQAL